MNGVDLTPTEDRIVKLLLDGADHSRKELCACLNDELSDCLPVHLTKIRKKIRPQGLDIVCDRIAMRYRMVRLLHRSSRQ